MNNKGNILDSSDIIIVHSKVNNPYKLESIYEDYKSGIYLVSGRYSEVQLSDEELWTSEAHDRSWLFWHHCLVSVAYLIDSYNVDNNKEKLNLAYDIVEKWFSSNFPESQSVMGWHDHSTALRLLHISKLYLSLDRNEDTLLLERLTMISEEHMKKLADPNFYMPKHNHGMDQDIALFIATIAIKDIPNKKSWKRLAIDRFWDQINNLFSIDGCYLEHSPHYIYLLADRLLGFYKILLKTDQDEAERLKERIEKIIGYFIYSLQPDGKFPTIGDSELQTFELTKDYWNYLPDHLLKILRIIKEEEVGEIDLPLDTYYPDGGYAFFRNNWANDKSTNHITFYSAFHSRVHKHHDDLSFTLYGHGMPLLIDAGKFTYQYDREERKYITSAYGHNTVRINSTETDISRLNIEKSGVLSFISTKNIGYSSGFHALTKDVTHRRIIFYLKPNDILVLDLIKGDPSTSAELIFNLNAELVSKVQKNEVAAYNESDEPVLFVKPLLGENDFKKYRGEINPLLGWSSNLYGEFYPNDLLIKKSVGSTIKFATHIRLDSKDNIESFSWKGNEIGYKWKNFDVKLYLTDFHEHMVINNKYYNTKKFFGKNKLLNSLTKNEMEHFKAFFNK